MFRVLQSFVIFLLIAAIALAKDDKEATCERKDGYTVCHRKGVLVEVTQQSSKDRLEIEDLDLLAIREYAFKNLTVEKLSFSLGNKISVVKRESFKGLPWLQRLDLDSNVVPLSPNLFAELEQLRTLSIIFNKINAVPKESFAGLTNLMWLYLSHNDIGSINKDTFSGLSSSLIVLWLNDNKIASIEPGSFKHVPEVSRLHLENNQLTSIQPGTFSDLRQLDGLFLHHNKLTSVSKTNFKGLTQLRILQLQHNEIASIEANAFAELGQLEQLDLTSNQLTQVLREMFNGLSSLSRIDLSDNKISFVESNLFKSSTALRYVYLMNNNVSNVDKKALGLPSSVSLFI